jgi:hypothetical protein
MVQLANGLGPDTRIGAAAQLVVLAANATASGIPIRSAPGLLQGIEDSSSICDP